MPCVKLKPASWLPAVRAHFLQADRWVRKGTPPPVSYHLKTTADNEIERDANGNAITVNASGQPVPRLPFVELGEARFHTGHIPSAVIGAGVDPVSDADPARFRRQHGIDGPYLLYVGRVDVEKGCRGLVEAFLQFQDLFSGRRDLQELPLLN